MRENLFGLLQILINFVVKLIAQVNWRLNEQNLGLGELELLDVKDFVNVDYELLSFGKSVEHDEDWRNIYQDFIKVCKNFGVWQKFLSVLNKL